MQLLESKRLVIKIGSALLVDHQQQSINHPWLTSLINDLAFFHRHDIDIILVSSGACAIGCLKLNLKRQQLSLAKQQATAAVGQIQLMHIYQHLLSQQHITAAQVLLTLEDSESRRRYLNARNTLENLLKLNVIPIINENDTIATQEIRYGDNDRLAAHVAQMLHADTLVLLSDIDGFYTADPNIDHKAKLIPVIKEIDSKIQHMAGESNSNYGSGGMMTKLAAAKIALNSGCRMLITAGQPLNPLSTFEQTKRGTWFIPSTTPITAKKNWLRNHLQPRGELMIDDGATQALSQGKSLLAVGIKKVTGHFKKGDPVRIVNLDQTEIARGLVNYANDEISKIKGKPSHQTAEVLGYMGNEEVVHRDNLILLF